MVLHVSELRGCYRGGCYRKVILLDCRDAGAGLSENLTGLGVLLLGICINHICRSTLFSRDKPSVKSSTPDNFNYTDHDAMTKSAPTNSFWF